MKRILSIVLAALMLSALIIPAALADGAGVYYVKTDNGRTLNVRKSPNGEVIGQFAYGKRIYVETITSSGWAQTYYGDYGDSVTAWVMARYLVTYDPGKYKAPAKTSPTEPAATASATDAAKVLADMNAEFKTGKLAAKQFTVYARPSRASGWVNLRWAPSLEAERIATCPQGKALTVICETRNWYQVQDPETGMIGFISKKFVSAHN